MKISFKQTEQKYIFENADTLTVEAIASHLSREPKHIVKFLRAQGIKPIWGDKKNAGLAMFSEKLAIKEELRQSPTWKRLKQKFTDDEVVLFEDKYVALITQFKDDVFATEENQIHKLITYDILMDRNMIQRKKILMDLEMMEREQKRIIQSVSGDMSLLDDKQRGQVEFLYTQIAQYRDQDKCMTKEYTDLEGSHQNIMKALKGTRDQRISKIESSKETFIGLLKRLQEDEARRHEGLNASLMDAATAKEYVRLTKPHKYMDSNEDQPILSAESIDFLEELHKDD